VAEHRRITPENVALWAELAHGLAKAVAHVASGAEALTHQIKTLTAGLEEHTTHHPHPKSIEGEQE